MLWVWFPRKIVYIAAAGKSTRGSTRMSGSDEFENKSVIIVAGIIFCAILVIGLIGVGLTLAT